MLSVGKSEEERDDRKALDTERPFNFHQQRRS